MNREMKLIENIRLCHPDIYQVSESSLIIFYREILKWNKTLNLVSRKDPERATMRLIIDSLYLRHVIEGNEVILDIGAGAGFPSIPLMLCHDACEIVMAESRKKRAAFLQHIIYLLKIDNASVVCETVSEDFFKDYESFDIIWAKAALPLKRLFVLGKRGLKKGGKLVFFRSFEKKDERERLRRAATEHGYTPPSQNVYSCPDLYLTRTITVCRR